MRVYLDNVIASGKVRGDLQPKEMAALKKIEDAEKKGLLETVTSRESWREQNRTNNPAVRAQLQKARADIPVVTKDHNLLGFHFQQDPTGGFVNYPLISDLVDEELFKNLQKQGLKDADARHLMYAISNDCDRFITTDPDFLDRRSNLKSYCGKLTILSPSEFAAELKPEPG